jgi:hypothetical protein
MKKSILIVGILVLLLLTAYNAFAFTGGNVDENDIADVCQDSDNFVYGYIEYDSLMIKFIRICAEVESMSFADVWGDNGTFPSENFGYSPVILKMIEVETADETTCGIDYTEPPLSAQDCQDTYGIGDMGIYTITTPFEIIEITFVPISTEFVTSSLAYIGQAVAGLGPYLVLLIGLPLSFVTIDWLINLISKK